MDIIFLVLYIFIFVFFIVKLVKCLKNKSSWKSLFLFEIISIIISALLSIYYDSLPGTGPMSGLTYIGEWFVNFGAAVLFVCVLIISFLAYIIHKIKNNKK